MPHPALGVDGWKVYETALHTYHRPAKQLPASLSATGGENRKTIRFLFSPFFSG